MCITQTTAIALTIESRRHPYRVEVRARVARPLIALCRRQERRARDGWRPMSFTSRKLYSRLRKDGASGFCQTLRAAACTDRPSVEGRLPWVRPHVSCPREMENIQYRRRPTTRSPNPNRASRCYYILSDVGTLGLFPSRTPVSPPRSGRASSPLGRRSRARGLPFDIPAGTSCCLQPACAGSNARM